MKIIIALLALFSVNTALANNIIVNGTRFIYPEESSEITIQMTNTNQSPSLAQIWLDEGDSAKLPEEITTPFIISPPIARIDAGNGQSVRIKKAADRHIVATDRESLWWLNILDIPSVDNRNVPENSSTLNLAIRSRFKLFWRPASLGDRQNAESKMEIIARNSEMTLVNPTPFYITVANISTTSGNKLLEEGVMVPPKSRTDINNLKHKVRKGEPVVLHAVSDYGSVVEFKTAINK
ncbi:MULTISPECIES: fimbrial biogenesis chaperone [Citrobacter]|uniref:Molecular chaperone n=1 Tax=Citrobacter cronae TaxID=1748967 RepID=A0ABS0ZZF0_9ENTR|nr:MULTISPECIES: molecular chaperone [Citrobacter]AWS95340.1 molecular chaperone [Citrobacter sp. CRE-46]MBJ8386277.1 molecular chaperone [Citrobacter cronae]MBJ8388947.1 molecular chaperone [Citrobacter cronae]MBX8968105.1 molecular chaperone [Citrobacter werkmanii]MBX9017854.1 molecular chaperone [Citrobacter werkmanii]